MEKSVQSQYSKYKMKLRDVHFSEMDDGFEHARMFADEVDMDESQTNMNASNVRSIFFDKQVATRTGELTASWGYRTPFEAKFWGDVKIHTTDMERFSSEEIRYFFSRREIYTNNPVTIWKDDTVITGRGLKYETQSRTGTIENNVVIRIWDPKTDNATGEKNVSDDGGSASETVDYPVFDSFKGFFPPVESVQ